MFINTKESLRILKFLNVEYLLVAQTWRVHIQCFLYYRPAHCKAKKGPNGLVLKLLTTQHCTLG